MPSLSQSDIKAYAIISRQAYFEPDPITGEDQGSFPVVGDNGSIYVELIKLIDGPLGFQARAFFNETTNELVIAFTGTEGADDLDVKA